MKGRRRRLKSNQIKGPHKATHTHGQGEATSQHRHRGQQTLRHEVTQAWGGELRMLGAAATYFRLICPTPHYIHLAYQPVSHIHSSSQMSGERGRRPLLDYNYPQQWVNPVCACTRECWCRPIFTYMHTYTTPRLPSRITYTLALSNDGGGGGALNQIKSKVLTKPHAGKGEATSRPTGGSKPCTTK